MQKIVPYLWFDDQAEEAAKLYTSVFKNSRTGSVARYDEAAAKMSGKKVGSALTAMFELEGLQFVALNGGPQFKFTPAVSFFVTVDDPQYIDSLWQKLLPGGSVMMELGKYPFSEKYGWLQDKFGLSWQFNLGNRKQKIAPCLMFVQKVAGKAQAAMDLYVSLFPNSKITLLSHYPPGGQDPVTSLNHAEFTLSQQEFMAMDSSLPHMFGFNEAISLLVNCETQSEVDYFWNNLTAGGEIQPCGWLKDRFTLSWQIVPVILPQLLQDPDPVKAGRVMAAMLKMKKIEIQGLLQAYEGK